MVKISPKFVRPQNHELAADPVYWFLRSVQAIVQVGQPQSFAPGGPTVRTQELLLPHTGQPLLPRAILNLPDSENRSIFLDQDRRHFHLLGGPRFNFGQSFFVNEGEIEAAAVSNHSLYLLKTDGNLIQIPTFQLAARVNMNPAPAISLRELHCVSLHEAWRTSGASSPTLACPLTETRDAVLLFDSKLENVILAECIGTSIRRREIALTISQQLRASINLTQGMGQGARIMFFDQERSRLFTLDPFELRPRLKAIVGEDAPSSRNVSYGRMSLDGRLIQGRSVLQYRVSPRIAEIMSGWIRFDAESIDHRKTLNQHLSGRSNDLEEVKRQLLLNAGFLVLFEPESCTVATCSLPAQDVLSKRLLPPDARLLLPICGGLGAAAPRVSDPFAGLPAQLRGFSEVAQGPESSLLFWQPGESRVVLLEAAGAAFSQLLSDHAHIEALNGLMGRSPHPHDSN